MLRTILTATALLCISQAAFAQEMTAEQRSACMGDYEKYCKGVAPGRRTHHRLPRQGERQDHAGLQEGAGGRREEMRRRLAFMPAVDRTEIGVHARRDRIRRTLRRNFQEEDFNT